jgi:hypothetical protein
METESHKLLNIMAKLLKQLGGTNQGCFKSQAS